MAKRPNKKIWSAFSFELAEVQAKNAKKSVTAKLRMFYCKFVEGSSGEWTAINDLEALLCFFLLQVLWISNGNLFVATINFCNQIHGSCGLPETPNFRQLLVKFLLCRHEFDFQPERLPDAWSESIKLRRRFEFNENLLCKMSFSEQCSEFLNLLSCWHAKLAIWSMFLSHSNLTLSVNRFSIVQVWRCRCCSCCHVSFRECSKEA